VAIVMGGGQTPGQTVGNGRATAMVLAREGARVVVVDRDLASAQDTVEQIHAARGEAEALQADAVDEDAVRCTIATVVKRHGCLDICTTTSAPASCSATRRPTPSPRRRSTAASQST
jgi:NAD(P)-dependent dehydrogenase (short-subunit alcohol dehydrogenase family)